MRNFVASLVMRFVDRLSQPARASARAIGDIAKAERMAKAAGDQWSRGLDNLDKKLGRLANVSLVTEGLDRAGQAMMRRFQGATRSAADFEAGMTGIGITAQMTDRQLQPMRRTILQTASDLGALPSTVQSAFAAVLAEGVYRTETELTRAGVAVSRFQKLAARMRDPISGEEAGGLSAGLATSFNIAADRLEQANAMLNRASQRGGVGIGVQARNLPSQAAAMRGLGGNTEAGLADLLAANQTAKRGAGNSEIAANNISNVLGAITSPETLKNFREAGVNLEREIKQGVERGISPLETVAAVTKRITGGDQFRIGELFGDRQARDGMVALVQNFEEFRDISRDLRSENALSAYYADLDRALQGSLASAERYQSAMARGGIAVGTILAPAVSLAADVLGKVANWMSKAAESSNPLAKAAVWIAAGFAGFAVSAGVVGHAVMGVLGPMWIMKSLFGELGGSVIQRFTASVIGGLARARVAALAFNITMLANPVVLAVAAAVAAVAIIALIVRKYWAPISAFFVGFGRGLAVAFAPLGAALAPLKPVWDAIVGGVKAAWNWVTRLLQPVVRTQEQLAGATNAGERFGRIIGAAIMGVVTPFRIVMAVGRMLWPVLRGLFAFSPIGMIVTNWRPIVSIVRTVITGALAVARAVWGGLRGLFAWSPLGQLIANWRPIVSLVRGVIGGAINYARYGWAVLRAIMAWSPVGVLRTAWSAVGGFFGGLVARFTGFGRAVIQGMINGILSMLGSVGSAVGQIGSSAVTAIRNRLGIRSPSRVFAALGGDTIAGFTLGLDRARRRPVASVAAMGAALVTSAASVALPLPAFARPTTAGVLGLGSQAPGRPEGVSRASDFSAGSGFRFDGPAASSSAGADTRPAVTVEKIEQHFHMPAGFTDAKSIARELKRLGDQGTRAALNDGDLP